MPGCPGIPMTSPGGAFLGTVDIIVGYPMPTLFNDPLNTSSTGGPSLLLMEDAHDMAYDLATDSILHGDLEDDGGSCSCCCVDLQMTGPTFMHQWFIADDNPQGTTDGYADRDYWPGGSSGVYMNLMTSYTYHFNVGQYEPCEEIHGGLYSFRSQDDAQCIRERFTIDWSIPAYTWSYYSGPVACGHSWGYQEPALAYALFGDGAGFIYAAGSSPNDYRVKSITTPTAGFEYLSLCLPCMGFDEEPCIATCANAQHYGHQNPTEPAPGPGYQSNFPYVGSVFESANCEVDPCSPNGLCFGPGMMAGPGPTACFSNNSLLDGSGTNQNEDNVCFDCESKALFHPCYDIDNPQTANNWGTNPDPPNNPYPLGNSNLAAGDWQCNQLFQPGNDSFGAPLVGATAWNSTYGGPALWAEYYNFKQDLSRWDECCTYRTIGCVDPTFANYNAVATFGGYDCDGNPDPNDEYTYWDASFPNPCGGGTGCMMCTTVPSTSNIGGPGSMNQHASLVDATGAMIQFQNPAVVTACCLLSGNDGTAIHPLGWNNTDALFTSIECCSNAGCMDGGAGGVIWENGTVGIPPGPTHAAAYPFLGTAPYYPGYDVTIGNVLTPVSLTQSPIAATNYSIQFTQDCTQVQGGGIYTFPNECCEYDIPGCMDAAGGPNPDIFGNGSYFVWNYNPYATVSDGSCFEDEPIGGCVDNGGPSTTPPLLGNVPVPPFWPQHPGIPAIDFDPDANIATNTCTWLYGCPDPYANNYDPCVVNPANAACLGTGVPHPINGIVYPVVALMSMCNYDIAGAGPGCMDPTALNYNPLSTQDCLGNQPPTVFTCCVYPVEGCTDHNAINYDPLAINDDGSCEYDISTTQEGINWLYGTKVLLCRDPLTKEEVLMGVCDQPEIQSEIFIERGKQSVMEPNLRLGEINTMGGLINHGYKYFRIKK